MNLSNFNFYNEDLKKEYLSQYNDDSQVTIAYILDKATSTEFSLKKDLATFNEVEIALVLHIISPLNIQSAIRNAGVIKNYIEWGITKGLSSTNLNPLDGLSKDWYEQFVGNKKTLFSHRNIKSMLNDLVNYQDKLPIILAFEGVLGEDMSEQCNLDKDSYDINNNLITVKDSIKGEREVEISDECLAMIDKAYNEEVYQLKNGLSTGRVKERPLWKGKYILKAGTNKRSDADAPVSKFVLYKRLREAKEFFGQPFLSYKNIFKSGQIKMACDLFLERGKLTNEELELIAIRFNLSKTASQGTQFSFSDMKEYINRNTILKLYNVDIDK